LAQRRASSPETTANTDNKDDLTAVEPAEEEPLLTDADMPELNTLTTESDMSLFFNRGVSAALRKAALNTLFQLPQFNIRDGLNDYDEDYTVFEPLGDTITSDMKFHQRRKEREEREAAEREEQERLAQEELENQEALAENDQTENENDASDELESTEDDALTEDGTPTSDDTTDDSVDEPEPLDEPALHADSQSVTTEKSQSTIIET